MLIGLRGRKKESCRSKAVEVFTQENCGIDEAQECTDLQPSKPSPSHTMQNPRPSQKANNTRRTDGGHIDYCNYNSKPTSRAAAGCQCQGIVTLPSREQRQRLSMKADGKAHWNDQPRRHCRLWSSQWDLEYQDAQKRLLSPSTSTPTAQPQGASECSQCSSLTAKRQVCRLPHPLARCEKGINFESHGSICEALEDDRKALTDRWQWEVSRSVRS